MVDDVIHEGQVLVINKSSALILLKVPSTDDVIDTRIPLLALKNVQMFLLSFHLMAKFLFNFETPANKKIATTFAGKKWPIFNEQILYVLDELKNLLNLICKVMFNN